MAVTLNASTSTGYIQTADTSGDLALQSNGTTQLTVSSTGAYGQLKSGTAVASTSGTAIDFTSIPSWVKRITVMFSGVSTNGTSGFSMQLGTSGGFETSGYSGSSLYSTTGTPTASQNSTSFIIAGTSTAAATTLHGIITLALLNASTNTWAEQSSMGGSNNNFMYFGAGSKALSGVLTQIRISGGGTDTFDAGTINILYEG